MFDEVGFTFGVRRIRRVDVTLPTHYQYQYKIESIQLISSFAIYSVLRNKPDGSELFPFDDARSEVYDTSGCDSPESWDAQSDLDVILKGWLPRIGLRYEPELHR